MPEPESTDTEAKTNAATPAGGGGEEENAVKIPTGVIPIFFSGGGQQIFQCVVDKDVTPDSPLKLIPKEKILEDFTNRAAVSDFHPVKKKVQVRFVSI